MNRCRYRKEKPKDDRVPVVGHVPDYKVAGHFSLAVVEEDRGS
jgi:hypothetical protein